MTSISALRFKREGEAFESPTEPLSPGILFGCVVVAKGPWWRPQRTWNFYLDVTANTFSVTRRGRLSTRPVPKKLAFAIYLAAMRQ